MGGRSFRGKEKTLVYGKDFVAYESRDKSLGRSCVTHFTTFNHVIKGDRCQSCFGELIILLTDCVCYVFLIMYIIYFDVIFEE